MPEAVELDARRRYLVADPIGHREDRSILKRPRGHQSQNALAGEAPDVPLIRIVDPIGAVNDEVGSHFDGPPQVFGKYQIVADGHTDLAQCSVGYDRPVSRTAEFSFAREEMDLVIGGDMPAVRREEKLGVVNRVAILGKHTDGEMDPAAARNVAQFSCDGSVIGFGQGAQPIPYEIPGRAALRKDRNIGAETGGKAGEMPYFVEIGCRLSDHAIHLHDRNADLWISLHAALHELDCRARLPEK